MRARTRRRRKIGLRTADPAVGQQKVGEGPTTPQQNGAMMAPMECVVIY